MRYKLSNCFFKTKHDKHIFILKKVLSDLDYIGKETKLSETENELRKLSIKDVNKVIKFLDKERND